MSDRTAQAFIRINGQAEPLAWPTLSALLQARDIGETMRGVAVAINGAVVPRVQWPQTPLNPGDAIEIVRARQGG